ncbi:hypothetical protein D4764_12G0010930 [Xyrichtys novacula]|uniref:SGNH hydrolase-type esterase domain-containing protein n=1 Tax=Xyrichtys novacula TaxID=13765 RepID=A0AAV1FAM8_XYRNO|nr:hypothetical protein D4764_12G0010930 [Xyrichtys novacula]
MPAVATTAAPSQATGGSPGTMGSPAAEALASSNAVDRPASGPGLANSRMPLDARVKKTSALPYSGPRTQPSKGEIPTVAPGSTWSPTSEPEVQQDITRTSSAASRRKLLREAVHRRSVGSVPRAASQNDSIPQRELEVASTPRLRCATSTSPGSSTAPPIAPLFAPTTVIIGDSITRGIRFFNVTTLSFPGATAADIANKIPSLLRSLPSSIRRIIVHIGCNDTARRQSEQTKCDFKRLLNSLKDCGKSVFISGPLPTMTQNCERFSRLLSLNSWTNMLCNAQNVHFIDNFNSFWNRPDYFNSDGIHLNRSGRSILVSNIQYSVHTSAQID